MKNESEKENTNLNLFLAIYIWMIGSFSVGILTNYFIFAFLHPVNMDKLSCCWYLKMDMYYMYVITYTVLFSCRMNVKSRKTDSACIFFIWLCWQLWLKYPTMLAAVSEDCTKHLQFLLTALAAICRKWTGCCLK